MKYIARMIIAVASTLVVATVPVLADESVMERQEQTVNKKECFLLTKNCPTDSIQERIQNIQSEINKGSAVYSNDELRHLNSELEEAQKLMELEITNGGA